MTQANLSTLERRISAERFAPYLAASADDRARAIRLYERNLALSAAFWEVLSDLEILVRRDVHEAMRGLHLLRNRIAHHEPIHNRPLAKLHDQALTTAEWVCPITREWIAARSRVPDLLSAPLDASPGV